MSGVITITVNPLPTAYSVTGGGSYCAGGTGVSIGLAGSSAGVSYRLYNGSGAIGGVVNGTGSTVSFGAQMAAGTYTVVGTDATSGCTNKYERHNNITINALPTVYTVTGGGSFCSGSNGVHVGLNNSAVGISYQLYNEGGSVGGLIPGTGGALDSVCKQQQAVTL